MNKRVLSHEKQEFVDHRSDRKKVPVVYFDYITFPNNPNEKPRIKIGFSGNHDRRRKQHAKPVFGLQVDVQPLCVVRGTVADEKHVQRYFAKYCVPGETESFWVQDDLVGYIRWLRDRYFVWVPDDDYCETVDNLDCVDSSEWMPSPDRIIPPPISQNLFDDYGPLRLPPRKLTIDDFFTSQTIIEPARRVLGNIDLDPASHPVANQVVKANCFFTAANSALCREWAGRVWLNPPFSQWERWVPKIIDEWKSGRIEAMCILCATRTLTAQYFAPIHRNCDAICILRGRIPFWGGRASTPDDGHAVFYFGKKTEHFKREMGSIGTVYIKGQGE